MALTPGTRLGGYEILSLIGSGGMGEVYRARDSRLNRDVAIKVLLADVAAHHDRLARFEREAQVLASLNHPNIANIFGVDDSSGAPALVMELVEGPTLADRIAKGPIPLDEALPIAKQIAEALEAAHEQGIIHRDLKPANIKVRSDGTVKVLDFGLAKAMASAPDSDIANSPTLTFQGTRAGVLLGTAAYMSPEQARAQMIDQRTDIWSFGCVLFEMLTGRRLFDGRSVTDTLAAIVRQDISLAALPADTPEPVVRVMQRCLQRDQRLRLRDIGDARIELVEIGTGAPTQPSPIRGRRVRRIGQWSAGIAVLLAIAAVAWFGRSSSTTSGSHALHVDLAPPPAAAFVTGMSAIAPDARNVAFVARSTGGTSLWVHSFETGVNRQIPGTDGAAFPFWSADSRSVAFFAAGALRRVDISGSAGPVVVCEAPVGRGGAWNASGVVIFNAVNDGPLLRVAASGGTPIALTAMERTENSHRFPAFFADGEHFVYFARGTDRNTQGIYLSSLSDPRHRSLLVRSTTSGTIATSPLDHHEYLLWIESAALRTQRIEPTAGLVGQPTTLMESVGLGGAVGQSPLSASHDGNLIIETAPDAKTQLSWYGRDGKIGVRIGDLDTYRDARLSPDGRTIAVLKYDRQWDVWLIDVERGVPSRLTFEGAGAGATTNDFAWSPDGQRLAFANGAAPPNIVARVIGGPPVDERLAESRGSQTCPDWSTDGAWLLYTEIPNDPASKTRSDLYARRMDVAGARPISYLASTFGEKNGRFSPDAEWVAYTSDESGRDEVYVASFPAGRGKWRISIAGGDFPRWRADGRELFYAAPDATLMAVTVRTTSSSLQFGAPIALFKVQGPPGSFDVAADGQRVLALTATGSERSNVVLIVNWPAVVPKNDGNVR